MLLFAQLEIIIAVREDVFKNPAQIRVEGGRKGGYVNESEDNLYLVSASGGAMEGVYTYWQRESGGMIYGNVSEEKICLNERGFACEDKGAGATSNYGQPG